MMDEKYTQYERSQVSTTKMMSFIDKFFYIFTLVVAIVFVSRVHFFTVPAISTSVKNGTEHSFSTGSAASQFVEIGGDDLIEIQDRLTMQKNILAAIIPLAFISLCLVFLTRKQLTASIFYFISVLGCHLTGVYILGWSDYSSLTHGAGLSIVFFLSLVTLLLLPFNIFLKTGSNKDNPITNMMEKENVSKEIAQIMEVDRVSKEVAHYILDDGLSKTEALEKEAEIYDEIQNRKYEM